MHDVVLAVPGGREITIGSSRSLAFILGPCVVESRDHALRSATWFYGESEEVGVYDMLADPFQLRNLRRLTSPGDLDAFHRRALAYSVCRGASCRP